jgi:hypothetical protein
LLCEFAAGEAIITATLRTPSTIIEEFLKFITNVLSAARNAATALWQLYGGGVTAARNDSGLMNPAQINENHWPIDEQRAIMLKLRERFAIQPEPFLLQAGQSRAAC